MIIQVVFYNAGYYGRRCAIVYTEHNSKYGKTDQMNNIVYA